MYGMGKLGRRGDKFVFWFDAREVWSDNIPGSRIFAVILAEEPHGDGERLEVQAPDPRDKEQRYCLVVGSGQVAYECVISWYIVGKLLHLKLSTAGARLLGIPALVEISIQKPVDIISKVAKGLQRILRMAPIVASAKMIGTEPSQ
jgi:Immunity protein 10